MLVKLKSNGRQLKLSQETWDNMTKDQQLRYAVIDKSSAEDKESTQIVTNEVGAKKKK